MYVIVNQVKDVKYLQNFQKYRINVSIKLYLQIDAVNTHIMCTFPLMLQFSTNTNKSTSG